METVTASQFARHVGAVKLMALSEPVFVTSRGKPTHVLLGIDAYRASVAGPTLREALVAHDDIDFSPPRLDLRLQAASLA